MEILVHDFSFVNGTEIYESCADSDVRFGYSSPGITIVTTKPPSRIFLPS